MSTADLANQCRGAGVPIVLVDTCCFLDVVRFYPKFLLEKGIVWLDEVESATYALNNCSQNGFCRFVVSSVGQKEFNDNIQSVCKEAISRATEHYRFIESLSGFLSKSYSVGSVIPCLPTLNSYVDAIKQVANSVTKLVGTFDSCTQEENPTCMAVNRVKHKLLPSRKGALKDALMYEEFLEFIRHHKSDNNNVPCIIFSSDKKAFGNDNTYMPNQKLLTEVTNVKGKLVLKWSEVVKLLKKHHRIP